MKRKLKIHTFVKVVRSFQKLSESLRSFQNVPEAFWMIRKLPGSLSPIFFNCKIIHVNGRFKVCLPWLEEHTHLPLPQNYKSTKKRLHSLRKVNRNLKRYSQVFSEWQEEDIIEEESPKNKFNEDQNYHVPHLPAVKEAVILRRSQKTFFKCSVQPVAVNSKSFLHL